MAGITRSRAVAVGATSALAGLALLPLAPGHAAGIAAAPANTYIPYATTLTTGEPSIGYDPIRDAVMYGAGTANKRLTFDDSTVPAKVTIADARPMTSATSLDAITFVDQATGRSFVSQLAGATSLFSYSDDAGRTYTPSQGSGAGVILDHQSVGGGPFHASSVPGGLGSYPDAVYYCAQNSYSGACAVSPNGGLTFNAGVPAYNSPANATDDPDPTIRAEGGACSAIHGHVRVGPDGTAYLPIKGCGGEATTGNLTNTEFAGGHPAVSVTVDNGTSWQVHRIEAGNNPDERDPSVGIGRGEKTGGKGRVYLGWEDGTNVPATTGYGTSSSARIATSTDGGKTFSAPVDVSSPLGIKNVQFPEVIAGDDDRAAFAWLGSTSAGDDQHNPGTTTAGSAAIPATAVWHLYVSTTYDGGLTYTTVDTTPTGPVQRGCIDLQGTSNKTALDNNICATRNLLDFNDITVDKKGRVLVAYGDGCTTAVCLSKPTSPSKGSVDFVMRQSTGRGLYAVASGGSTGVGTASTTGPANGIGARGTASGKKPAAKKPAATKPRNVARPVVLAAPGQPTRTLAFTGLSGGLAAGGLTLVGVALLLGRRRVPKA